MELSFTLILATPVDKDCISTTASCEKDVDLTSVYICLAEWKKQLRDF